MTKMQKISAEVKADETSSIPVLEGFEPVKLEMNHYSLMTKMQKISQRLKLMKHPPFLYWKFEPIETGDEPLQSDDQNAEDFSEVKADETSSIPVLEGFEPIETAMSHYSLTFIMKKTITVSDANEERHYRFKFFFATRKVEKRPAFVPDSSEEVDLKMIFHLCLYWKVLNQLKVMNNECVDAKPH